MLQVIAVLLTAVIGRRSRSGPFLQAQTTLGVPDR
jgi:hypothetical protein